MKNSSLILVLIIWFTFGAAIISAASVICADANGDNKVNLSDISYTINFLYRGGPAPDPLKAADPDNSNKINLLDISYTINYLYRGGPRPVCSKYLGQLPPDSVPQVFAPGLISTSDMEFTASFDPSFQEFYFTRRGTDNINKIYFSEIVDGHWSDPAIAPFCDAHFYMEPLLTPDGQKMLFSSDRPCSGCIFANWYVTKSGSTWSDPQTLGAPFNSIMMMYTTQSSNGNIYFTNIIASPSGIYVSRLVDGSYQTPERLGTAINKGYSEAHPYIAPDESYMIFDAQNRPGGVGGSDLYISYRNEDGSWTESINLGSNINTTGEDLAPTVTPDGEYFFYARPNGAKHDIYWCNTSFIAKLRPN